jgi:6-phosphofructokinase 1
LIRFGVLTAGGNAPGMNTAIRSIVRSAIYEKIEVVGFEKGYSGLIEDQALMLGARSVGGIINLGGTILKTRRCEEMKTPEGLKKASDTLKKHKIDGVVVIGGDGSLRGAHELHEISRIPVIGIPATIDNDVAETDTTIGFDTAVNTALSAIDKIRDTATSHERVFIVEVMGRKRGFLALAVGLADGAEEILVPEIEYDLDKVCDGLNDARDRGKTSMIIVMAEGAGDSRYISNYITRNTEFEVRLAVLGHLQRGGSPTAASRILACNFGYHAVKYLQEGKENTMTAIKNGRIIPVNLIDVIQKEKELDMNQYELARILSK